MGRQKAQTRITANTDGHPRLLFSVRDSSTDGSLHVRFPELDRRVLPDGSLAGVQRAHISVHPSRGLRGNVINFTTLTDAGDEIVQRAEITSPSAWLLTPLLVRRQWYFENDEIFEPGPRDVVQNIVRYWQGQNTLIYGVFAVAKGFPLPAAQLPFVSWRLEFRRFSLLIYLTTMPVAAQLNGESMFFETHSPRVNEGASQVLLPDAKTIRARDLHRRMLAAVELLRQRYLDLAAEYEPQSLDVLREHSSQLGMMAVLPEEAATAKRNSPNY